MRRLNLFQATMLRWRELYPYSAVHVVRVSRPLDAPQLESGISRALESFGLTGLELDAGARRYAWRGGDAAVKLNILAGGLDPSAARDAEIERQLNIAFNADARIDPFRFFAIDAGTFFHLGIAYDHFVAAGDAIVRLLKNIVDGAANIGPVAARLNPYAPSYAHLFWREKGALLAGLANLPSLAAECRRAARPRYQSPEDGYNAFTSFRIEPAERATLARAAATWQVSLHDLLLAVSLEAFSKLAPERRSASRRRDIALASIVNIRSQMGRDAADTVAPCLASFRVGHSVPPDIGLRDLTAAVHTQTDRIRRRKLHLQTLLAMAVAGVEWRFLSRHRRLRFYAKHYPVWAGITSLNVNSLWTREGEAATPPQYVRAGSTGPLAPMTMTLTTHGETIEAGLSFRTTVYSRDVAQSIAAGMLGSIRSLEH